MMNTSLSLFERAFVPGQTQTELGLRVYLSNDDDDDDDDGDDDDPRFLLGGSGADSDDVEPALVFLIQNH